MQLSIFFKLFEVIFPVFLIIGIGYWFGSKNPNFKNEVITEFAGKIGVPALLFYSLAASTTLDFLTFIKFGLFTFIFVGCFAIIGIALLKVLNRDPIAELSPLILPNTGNLGLPICLFAYGDKGFSIAGSIAAIIMLLHFTLGILIASKKFSLKPLTKSIPMYTLLISGFMLYSEIKPPVFLINATMLLSYSTIFLILASLGIALSNLHAKNFKSNLIISVVRLVSGPFIALLIIYNFSLKGFEAGVLLICASMPSAVLNFLLAKMYSKKIHSDNIASVIMISTTLSFVTIPLVVYFALKYFN
ncbi:MAG: transporter [Pelagibacteraceae bacterium TMED136]|nr:MAG: transporter [Pelagibacteraceae bacterium TMED136]